MAKDLYLIITLIFTLCAGIAVSAEDMPENTGSDSDTIPSEIERESPNRGSRYGEVDSDYSDRGYEGDATSWDVGGGPLFKEGDMPAGDETTDGTSRDRGNNNGSPVFDEGGRVGGYEPDTSGSSYDWDTGSGGAGPFSDQFRVQPASLSYHLSFRGLYNLFQNGEISTDELADSAYSAGVSVPAVLLTGAGLYVTYKIVTSTGARMLAQSTALGVAARVPQLRYATLGAVALSGVVQANTMRAEQEEISELAITDDEFIDMICEEPLLAFTIQYENAKERREVAELPCMRSSIEATVKLAARMHCAEKTSRAWKSFCRSAK